MSKEQEMQPGALVCVCCGMTQADKPRSKYCDTKGYSHIWRTYCNLNGEQVRRFKKRREERAASRARAQDRDVNEACKELVALAKELGLASIRVTPEGDVFFYDATEEHTLCAHVTEEDNTPLPSDAVRKLRAEKAG